ncbi:radical SAM protein [Kitasatospora sp. NPDC094028]
MNERPTTLLINPPLWNVYAPHLAVPLLTGVLRRHGWPVRALDLSARHMAWTLSGEGVGEAGKRLAGGSPAAEDASIRALADVLLPSVERDVDGAWKSLTGDASVLFDHDRFRSAVATVRNALICHSAAFPGFRGDLSANRQFYSERSTDQVLLASRDPDRNPYRWSFERLLPPHLDDPRIKLVGISVSADTQLIAAMTVAAIVRELRPDVHITMGGNFITRVVGRWTGRNPFFDLVDDFILYEGEDAIVALCENLFGDGRTDVPGLVRATADGLTRARPRDVRLDSLPAPDFDDYDLHAYLAPGLVLPVLASRSCAWDCAFCSIPFASNRFRHREATAVADELEHLSERYGTRTFMFVDEIMTQRTLREVGAELVRRDSDLRWYGETRFAKGLTPDLADLLYRSGCRRLDLGLESYNQRVLDLMRKGVDVKDVAPNIDALLGAGVPVHLFCMTGFPGERPDEAERTARFVDDTLRRSREEYGIPYSTSVNGPFVLDLLSPVGTDPDAFGVRVVPPPAGEDLALSADYHVVDGLDQAAAARASAGTDVDRWATADAPFQHQRLVGESEEYTFLRCVHAAGIPEPHGPLPARVFRPSRDTAVRPAADIGWRQRSDGVRVHSPRADALVSGSPAWRTVLTGLAASTGTVADVLDTLVADGVAALDALAELARLAALGALEIDAYTEAPTDHDGTVAALPVRGWRAAMSADGELVEMVDAATGRQVRLNAAAYLLWDGLGRAPGPEGAEDPARWWRAVRGMATQDLVLLVDQQVLTTSRRAG